MMNSYRVTDRIIRAASLLVLLSCPLVIFSGILVAGKIAPVYATQKEIANVGLALGLISAILIFGLNWIILHLWNRKMMDRFGISGEETVTVVLKDINPDSFLYAAGLRNDDVILKVDNESVSSLVQIKGWWLHKASMQLTVLRDNDEVIVNLAQD